MTDTVVIPPSSTPPPAPPSGGANNTKAVITLVLGILSMPCFCGFLAGIPAMILGHLELKAINAGQSPESNRQMTKIGFILGIVGTALTCIGFIAYIALFGFAIYTGEMQSPSTF